MLTKKLVACLGAAIVAFVPCRSPAISSSNQGCNARQVLAAVRREIGRPPAARYTVATGTFVENGLVGTFRQIVDRRTGAQHTSIDTPPILRDTVDGTTERWIRDESGGVRAYNAPALRAAAVTRAYLARLTSLREPNLACETLDTTTRLRIVPAGGIPVILDIDRRTHLINDSILQLWDTTETTTYDDYRWVEKSRLPFHITVQTAAPDVDSMEYRARRIVWVAREPAAEFTRPHPRSNVTMTGTATRVAMSIEGGRPIVTAFVNGHAMPFLFDTGGNAILTPQAAQQLGLKMLGNLRESGAGEGSIASRYAMVATLALGAATIRRIPVEVVPLPYAFRERGRRPPLAGLIGQEFLERFAVRFDYPHRTITLFATTPPAGPHLPMFFESGVPLAHAAADGHGGLFMVDTGNSGSLVLLQHFLRAHGFYERYTDGLRDTAQGVGGKYGQMRHRIAEFTFAGRDIRNVVTNFVALRRGALSTTTLAGNIGYAVLSPFAVTFDYAGAWMAIDGPAANIELPPFDRSGLRIEKDTPDAINTTLVYPASPAADAGIKAGDQITSVNGVAARELSGSEVFETLHQAPGTRVALDLSGPSGQRSVVLVLRELKF